jgi:MFS family permease
MSGIRSSKWFFAFLPYKMAFGMTSVLVPLFVISLGGTVADVGLVTAAFLMTSIPASILWANFSDRSGSRKIFILFAFLSTSMTFLLFALATDSKQFLLFNAIQGFLITAAVPVSGMLIVEDTPKSQWEFQIGLFNFIGGIGWALGLLLGATYLDIRILFFACLLLCDTSFLLSYFWIKEPHATLERESLSIFIPRLNRTLPSTIIHLPTVWERRLFRTLKNGITPSLPLYYLGTLLIFMGATAFFTPLTVYMRLIGISVGNIFLIFFGNSLIAAVSYPIVARLSRRWDDRKLVTYSTFSRVFLFSAAIFTTIIPTGIVPFFLASIVGLAGFTWSFIAVCGVALVPKLSMLGREGSSMGVYNAMSALGGVIGAIVGSTFAYTLGYEAAFLFAASLIAIGMIAFLKIKV